jgi:hypothetical protein
MKHTHRLCALALFILPALGLSTLRQEPAHEAERPPLAAAAFLTGAWVHEEGQRRIEEHWIEPAGGTLLGVGRTVRGERNVFFEFLRIEQRGDALVLVAHPSGGSPTEFTMTDHGPGRVVFENPEHDDPQRIEYVADAEGGLVIHLSGLRDGEPRKTQHRLERR